MVDETELPTQSTVVHKRKKVPKKRHDSKRIKGGPGMPKKAKVSQKMQKLFRKRARNYNSDDDDEEEEERESKGDGDDMEFEKDGFSDDELEHDKGEEKHVQTGIKFDEGCKDFRMAFQSIMKKYDDESLGPVLSAHKRLVVEKLSEEVAERKVKGEAKKEKHMIEEKGHVIPANFLDSHEKFLIGVATKGVVKLFNAVNKAQIAQKELDPSRFRDAKALTKRRKEAFMTELSKSSAQSTETTSKASMAKNEEDGNQPGWAPLRDTFMLTNSKLKDWDKMAEAETEI